MNQKLDQLLEEANKRAGLQQPTRSNSNEPGAASVIRAASPDGVEAKSDLWARRLDSQAKQSSFPDVDIEGRFGEERPLYGVARADLPQPRENRIPRVFDKDGHLHELSPEHPLSKLYTEYSQRQKMLLSSMPQITDPEIGYAVGKQRRILPSEIHCEKLLKEATEVAALGKKFRTDVVKAGFQHSELIQSATPPAELDRNMLDTICFYALHAKHLEPLYRNPELVRDRNAERNVPEFERAWRDLLVDLTEWQAKRDPRTENDPLGQGIERLRVGLSRMPG